MAKKSKKMQEALKKVDATKTYSVEEAVALAKETNIAKFDATVEVAYRLNIDTKKADQQIRGAVVLPNGTGKTQKVLVFAKGAKAKEAEEAGADYVGEADLAEKIQNGWFDFDVVIATDRKSTRLNSSHVSISYAVFCLKKKKKKQDTTRYVR